MAYRHELKYIIDEANGSLLQLRLKEVLKKDLHASPSGFYTVRSLYFDDYFNTAYNEKDMSILDREKFRIRLYNHSDQVIHLERKVKSNNYVFKEIAPLNRSEVEAILDENFVALRNSDSQLKMIFYHMCTSHFLRPRVIVDYEREPFIMEAGDVRITLDRNIRSGMEALNIFNHQMAMIEALEPNYLILEVKYTNFLPAIIKDILPAPHAVYTSMSKYVICCNKTMFKRRTSE